ncbi:PREDICTED: uncharacterized protein LOC106744993 [Dinoponera quadriceps]|uniref:Uncharacterized protein LOC106744993 n=1 Tax=Dinoponera quadriceps TaxID=609295 RepID=A0A6P3XBM1_DINQU|nr:PREDICTED: uncharacterized protein LOC106744993 [Dinoponera quadriceps]
MCRWTTVLLWWLSIASSSHSALFSVEKLRLYASILSLGLPRPVNETGNELWHGLFRDCSKRVTFSCIQKNAYSYLGNAFLERDNVTVFDGLVLTRNNVTYDVTCPRAENRNDVRENLVDDVSADEDDCARRAESNDEEADAGQGRRFEDEPKSPLEEIVDALRHKAMKFLSTRNYELQLPRFFFEGATVKISPREIDENGALLRVDFGTQPVQEQGRIFKKIKKFIQNKLLTSFLALLLIIKLIKVKFMFVIPFLFGVGTAKKLFLKLLLFFIPAFAHIFKLCSSYYSSHSTKFHHHHHQIAHHHHHVPVPVPVPTYYDHHHHHPHHENDDFDGYDYAHPHIQYRKDMEELKEWGIEPYDEQYEDSSQHLNRVVPAGSAYQSSYGISQYAPNVKPIESTYLDNSAGAHNLAYSGYLNDVKYNRRPALSVHPNLVAKTPLTNLKNTYAAFASNVRPGHPQVQRLLTPVAGAKSGTVSGLLQETDDEYYGPMIARLDDIFGQLRFYEESCRERLVCSMYKNPAVYSPHSNLVSNELSRDPQELKRGASESASSRKFHRYTSAARHGQNGGDCLRMYPCHVNTE